MIFEFGQYLIDVDINKTRLFYENACVVSRGCSCKGCRNYEKAVDILSPQIILFFSRLGVDMRKVCEVYVCTDNSDGTLLYGGFYHLCGTLLNGKSAWVSLNQAVSHWENDQAFEVENGFHISFRQECDLLEGNFPTPALQLEISANIPWVLEEENDYIEHPAKKSVFKTLLTFFNRTVRATRSNL